jgi:hypothetical protein
MNFESAVSNLGQMPSAPEGGGGAAHRAPELEDWLNSRIYHKLSFRLARLLRPTGVTPNMVSLGGVATVVAAALAYTRLSWPVGALVGIGLHMAWHVVDGADGDLARMTGKTSPDGEFVDGLCDYIGHVVLYTALAGMLSAWLGGWAWALATLAGASHMAQTNHYESLRRTYLWWGYGVPWLRNKQEVRQGQPREPGWFTFVFGWMSRDYLAISAATAPSRGEIDIQLDASAGRPELSDRLRMIVRGNARSIMGWSPRLGSNLRDLLLGASMLAGSPLWYFLIEIVLLNLLLLASLARSRKAVAETARQMRDCLETASPIR